MASAYKLEVQERGDSVFARAQQLVAVALPVAGGARLPQDGHAPGVATSAAGGNKFSARRRVHAVEFSVAAYRFGHSMVRVYDYNRNFGRRGTPPAAPLRLLFLFTGTASLRRRHRRPRSTGDRVGPVRRQGARPRPLRAGSTALAPPLETIGNDPPRCRSQAQAAARATCCAATLACRRARVAEAWGPLSADD